MLDMNHSSLSLKKEEEEVDVVLISSNSSEMVDLVAVHHSNLQLSKWFQQEISPSTQKDHHSSSTSKQTLWELNTPSHLELNLVSANQTHSRLLHLP
jgi:hypothetical protein